jgi:hypothetical protein
MIRNAGLNARFNAHCIWVPPCTCKRQAGRQSRHQAISSDGRLSHVFHALYSPRIGLRNSATLPVQFKPHECAFLSGEVSPSIPPRPIIPASYTSRTTQTSPSESKGILMQIMRRTTTESRFPGTSSPSLVHPSLGKQRSKLQLALYRRIRICGNGTCSKRINLAPISSSRSRNVDVRAHDPLLR